MRRLLYMPTHRTSSDAIASLTVEGAALGSSSRDNTFVVVIDQSTLTVGEIHRQACCDMTAKGMPTIHFGRQQLSALVDIVVRATGRPSDDPIADLLRGGGIRYGVGPNAASLVGAALGCTTLHRRDSDLLPDVRPDGPAFPIELESVAIGRRLSDIPGGVTPDDARSTDLSRPAGFVGSCYFGDAPLDRRALFSAGRHFVEEIEALTNPHENESSIRSFVDRYFFAEPEIRYDTDFIELDTVGRTELGVSCIGEMYRELPEMPTNDTLGCDYMAKNVLYQLGVPVLFHSRKMEHRYDATRGEDFQNYAIRDLRYIMLWRVWSAHNRQIREDPTAFVDTNGSLRQSAYTKSFRTALDANQASLAEIAMSFGDIYESAGRAGGESIEGPLTAVARNARTLAHELATGVIAGIEDYCMLVEAWPSLIEAASLQGAAIAGLAGLTT